ncbi:MAG: hypothetical protein QOE77_3742 [Blastocatellia bacterium]|nr:hypothetical protein [Blastocatellia bacterium]
MKLDYRQLRWLLLFCAAPILILALFAPAAAQCAMCRASVQNNAVFVRGLNLGVLVLLTPPIAIFCSIFIVAYRHRQGGHGDDSEE